MSKVVAKKKTLPQYAKEYGVHLRTVKGWSAKGYPLHDPDKLKALVSAQHSAPASFQAPDIAAAKLGKMCAEWELKALEVLVRKKKLIDKDEVREDGLFFGSILTSELAAIMNDMPGVLAGLDERGVRNKLGPRLEVLKANLKKLLDAYAS